MSIGTVLHEPGDKIKQHIVELSVEVEWNKYEEGLWQEIIKLKYVKDTPISLIKHRASDSPLWGDLLKIRHLYV